MHKNNQYGPYRLHLFWVTLFILSLPQGASALTASADAIKTSPLVSSLQTGSSLPSSPGPSWTVPQTEAKALPRTLDDLEEQAADLPPIVRPSQEEIREKIILEYKELEKALHPGSAVAYDLPIVINEQVEYFINYFQSKMSKRFSLWMARSTRYIPMMKKILNEHGLPEDLIYLAMIESGFSSKAYSRAHAVGIWQFIRETGNRYGLKTTSWVDERKDPIKSTQAAAKHLSDLFNRFGSWYLAAAGYNAGEGKITRALALYNAQNFWEISADHCHYVKDETKQYVPKMIAAALIAKEPQKYGFTNIAYQPPFSYEEVDLPGAVELKAVAAACGVDVETLVDLNPELKRWVTPPGVSSYSLRIPIGTKDRVMEQYAELTKPKPVITYAEHKVRKGERLAAIARRYGVQAGLIARTNRLNGHRSLNPGLVLLIPQKGFHPASFSMDADEEDLRPKGSEKGSPNRPSLKTTAQKYSPALSGKGKDTEGALSRIRYKVKKGDTLAAIAERFDVGVPLLKKWNPKSGDKILAGTTLNLFVDKSPTEKNGHSDQGRVIRPQRKSKTEGGSPIKQVLYTVKRGDSLFEIAQRFNTTPNQIRTWNKLSSKEHIRPGDKLSLKIKRTSLEKI